MLIFRAETSTMTPLTTQHLRMIALRVVHAVPLAPLGLAAPGRGELPLLVVAPLTAAPSGTDERRTVCSAGLSEV